MTVGEAEVVEHLPSKHKAKFNPQYSPLQKPKKTTTKKPSM
jgi:hypothetical protein